MTEYDDEDEDDEGLKLPFEAVIHITNRDAVVQLHSPWKVNSPTTSTGLSLCTCINTAVKSSQRHQC